MDVKKQAKILVENPTEENLRPLIEGLTQIEIPSDNYTIYLRDVIGVFIKTKVPILEKICELSKGISFENIKDEEAERTPTIEKDVFEAITLNVITEHYSLLSLEGWKAREKAGVNRHVAMSRIPKRKIPDLMKTLRHRLEQGFRGLKKDEKLRDNPSLYDSILEDVKLITNLLIELAIFAGE